MKNFCRHLRLTAIKKSTDFTKQLNENFIRQPWIFRNAKKDLAFIFQMQPFPAL